MNATTLARKTELVETLEQVTDLLVTASLVIGSDSRNNYPLGFDEWISDASLKDLRLEIDALRELASRLTAEQKRLAESDN